MPTRYAQNADETHFAPERALASSKVSGIAVPLNIIVRVARAREEEEHGRSMIWLHNYAKLRKLSADELASELELSRQDIRLALTDPEFDCALFAGKVQKLRDRFQGGRRAIVRTDVVKMVQKACRFSLEKQTIVEVIGKWRTGKTAAMRECYLDAMDRALWIDCPSDESERSFFAAIAAPAGFHFGSAIKPSIVRAKFFTLFGRRGIEQLFVDEAHYLWPSGSLRTGERIKPKRIELLREFYDRDKPAELGIAISATEQFAQQMDDSLREHSAWAPGQWEGRAHRFVIPDALKTSELESIARWHGPDLEENAIPLLVDAAKVHQGYAGLMVNTIERARYFFASPGGKITADHIGGALNQIQTAASVTPAKPKKGRR